MNTPEKTVERISFTAEECAKSLGISRSLAYQLIASGELPSTRIGNKIIVPVDALKEWVRSRTSR